MTPEERQEIIRRLEAGEELSHLIYAGANMIIVPSLFEPCGLTQMNPRSIAPSACGIPTRNISAS